MSNTVTSYMPTGNATVTRNAETWSYALTAAPQALSAYLKFKEMGTNTGAGSMHFLRLGGASSPDLFITYNGGYGGRFVTSGGTASAVVSSPLPVVGNIVELLMTLASNGVMGIQQTINGSAAVTGTVAAAKPLPQTWAANTFEVAVPAVGGTGIIACAVMRGVQSLDTMRRIAGAHTRNG